MWSEKEKKSISAMIEHLSVCMELSLGVTLKLDVEKANVKVINRHNEIVKEISIEDDSVFGALKDVTDSFE